ncbi:MAG: hypothetical protein M1818_007454 [Claussenomyces sp. TS43310]|nr:MAG: hypothetical protein M1818_007454 [Claussenomyces sp. TS43310]
MLASCPSTVAQAVLLLLALASGTFLVFTGSQLHSTAITNVRVVLNQPHESTPYRWQEYLDGSPRQRIYDASPIVQQRLPKEGFMNIQMDAALPTRDFSAINEKCSKTHWKDDLVFACLDSKKDIDHVRGELLSCIRLAIEVGASLVLPMEAGHLPKAMREKVENQHGRLNRIFDREALVSNLQSACPQMSIHTSVKEILATGKEVQEVPDVMLDQMEDIEHDLVKGKPFKDPEVWVTAFDRWFERAKRLSDRFVRRDTEAEYLDSTPDFIDTAALDYESSESPQEAIPEAVDLSDVPASGSDATETETDTSPQVVSSEMPESSPKNLSHGAELRENGTVTSATHDENSGHTHQETSFKEITLLQVQPILDLWPVCSDSEIFVNNFGGLLVFRPQIQRLAAAVLYGLTKRFECFESFPNETSGRFIGAYLQSSEDEAKQAWASYDAQKDFYVTMTKEMGITFLYLASEKDEKLDVIPEELFPRLVVTKHDLLNQTDLKALQKMEPAHQRAIDYLVMQKAHTFLGIEDSLFSRAVAWSRRPGTLNVTCGEAPGFLPRGLSYRDSRSQIRGPKTSGPRSRAHYSVMWP